MNWGIATLVFALYVLRVAWREQKLARALLLEMTKDGAWIGWPEFQDQTRLRLTFYGTFIVAGTSLVKIGALARTKCPPIEEGGHPVFRYHRRAQTAELYPSNESGCR